MDREAIAWAIYAAKAAGFDAVECVGLIKQIDAIGRALDETKLPLLGLNTSRGDVSTGENGLCALPLRVEEARASIDQALDLRLRSLVKIFTSWQVIYQAMRPRTALFIIFNMLVIRQLCMTSRS